MTNNAKPLISWEIIFFPDAEAKPWKLWNMIWYDTSVFVQNWLMGGNRKDKSKVDDTRIIQGKVWKFQTDGICSFW